MPAFLAGFLSGFRDVTLLALCLFAVILLLGLVGH